MDRLDTLTDEVRAFCEARDWDRFHGAKDLAIGLVTESSELLELFRFVPEAEVAHRLEDASFRQKVGDELADVCTFLLRFAQMHGFDLVAETRRKLAANEKRYPVERSRGSNRKADRA